MKTKSLGFIGGGRVVSILLQAFANKNATFRSLSVYDMDPNVTRSLKKQFPPINDVGNVADAAAQDVVFIALHPPVIAETLQSVKHFFSPEMIGVSLAPKISIEQLTQLTGHKKWIRMIPNAPSYINQGHNPFSVSPAVDAAEKKMLYEMFGLLGNSFQVNEDQLEAYAVIAAMSPTYFWYQWRKLADLGVSFGLSEEACRQALRETLSASAGLLFDSGLAYEEVADLIPVKPLQDMEELVSGTMEEKLTALYEKIKPQVMTTS